MAEILRLEHLEKSFGTHAVLRGVETLTAYTASTFRQFCSMAASMPSCISNSSYGFSSMMR